MRSRLVQSWGARPKARPVGGTASGVGGVPSLRRDLGSPLRLPIDSSLNGIPPRPTPSRTTHQVCNAVNHRIHSIGSERDQHGGLHPTLEHWLTRPRAPAARSAKIAGLPRAKSFAHVSVRGRRFGVASRHHRGRSESAGCRRTGPHATEPDRFQVPQGSQGRG